MTDFLEESLDVRPVETDAIVSEAWAAYAELLAALRIATHLHADPSILDTALELLLRIGESWTVAWGRDTAIPQRLPFGKRSEIDLVATLLSIAAYTYPHEISFGPLLDAFLQSTRLAPPDPHPVFSQS
jgi:hypothetical protein